MESSEVIVCKPRKKLKLFRLVFVFFLLLCSCFVIQFLGPNPKIIVGPETTVVDGPIQRDGFPDYGHCRKEQSRSGVTTENNAGHLIAKALWPMALPLDERDAFLEEVGIGRDQLPADEFLGPSSLEVTDRIQNWLVGQYLAKHPEDETALREFAAAGAEGWERTYFENNNSAVYGLQADAEHLPWTSEQAIPIANWINEQNERIDLLLQAAERSHLFLPSSLLPDEANHNGAALRRAARTLCTRAMWHAGEKRPRHAWTNLLAGFRIARIAAKRGTLMDQAVVSAIEELFGSATRALLVDDIPAPLIRQIENDLSSLEALPLLDQSLDKCERLAWLSFVAEMSRDGQALESIVNSDEEYFALALLNSRLDWNHVLRKTNERMDALVSLAGPGNIDKRLAASKALPDDSVKAELSVAALLSAKSRAELVAGCSHEFEETFAHRVLASRDRDRVDMDLTLAISKLALHRAENGEYPDTLEQLSSVPKDSYSNVAFVYEKRPDGFMLYSVGPNQRDDGGTNLWYDRGKRRATWAETEEVDLVFVTPRSFNIKHLKRAEDTGVVFDAGFGF